jgi:hypothetical protein
MKAFTAQNAATLSKQIDTFAAKHPDFAFTFGHDTKNSWFCHAECGARPHNSLTFAEVVEIANREARLHTEFEERS